MFRFKDHLQYLYFQQVLLVVGLCSSSPLANRCEAEHLHVGRDQSKGWKFRHAMWKTCEICPHKHNVHQVKQHKKYLHKFWLFGTNRDFFCHSPNIKLFFKYQLNLFSFHLRLLLCVGLSTAEIIGSRWSRGKNKHQRETGNERKGEKHKGAESPAFPVKLWRWTADVCRRKMSRL